MIVHTHNNLPHPLMTRHIGQHRRFPTNTMHIRMADPRILDLDEDFSLAGGRHGVVCFDLEEGIGGCAGGGEHCCGLGFGDGRHG